MKAETVLKKLDEKYLEGEKDQLIRGLSAVLLTIPPNRRAARTYIEKAMEYIQKN